MRWREWPQPLLPKTKPASVAGRPDIYPSHCIVYGEIEQVYESSSA